MAIQNFTVQGLLATLGLTGYNNVAATIGSPNTKLGITVTPPAYAILTDGTLLTTELVTTEITGLTTDGSYSLYLDYTASPEGNDPVWTVAASAPSATAIAVASVTVASSHLTEVTMAAEGLNGDALTALNITKVA